MLPLWYNVIWVIGCAAVYLLLVIPTIVSILRCHVDSRFESASWIILTVGLPPVGMIIWFLLARPRKAALLSLNP